jgi:hypothetical protein
VEAVPNVPEAEEGAGGFAQLAKQHWLKPSKKVTKVKVKPDILKSEIWDVLERDDFKFSDLLSLENLQILERQCLVLYWFITTTNSDLATSGLATLRIRTTTTSFLSC